nr:MAG TPA: hypothetical protein [Caudoviricetes sp.]
MKFGLSLLDKLYSSRALRVVIKSTLHPYIHQD